MNIKLREITQEMQERLQIFFGVTNTVENRLATLEGNGLNGQTFEQLTAFVAARLADCGGALRDDTITARRSP